MSFRVEFSNFNPINKNQTDVKAKAMEPVSIDIVSKSNSEDAGVIKHSDDKPLTEEQKSQKMAAKQKQLDEIASMKNAAANQDTVKITQEKVKLFGNEIIDAKVETSYSSDGKVKQKRFIFPDGNSNVQMYDEDGKKQFVKLYNANGILTKETEFNKLGDVLKKVQYFDDGRVYATEVNTYYPNGQIKSKNLEAEYKDGGVVSHRGDNVENMFIDYGLKASEIENYDENGNLIYDKSDNVDSSGEQIFSENTYEYDANGNLLKETKKSKSKLPEFDGPPLEDNIAIAYEYNSDNFQIRKIETDLDTSKTETFDIDPAFQIKSPRPGKLDEDNE